MEVMEVGVIEAMEPSPLPILQPLKRLEDLLPS